jgi:hypothetical protein
MREYFNEDALAVEFSALTLSETSRKPFPNTSLAPRINICKSWLPSSAVAQLTRLGMLDLLFDESPRTARIILERLGLDKSVAYRLVAIIRKADGRYLFVRNGGESNPGPKHGKARQKKIQRKKENFHGGKRPQNNPGQLPLPPAPPADWVAASDTARDPPSGQGAAAQHHNRGHQFGQDRFGYIKREEHKFRITEMYKAAWQKGFASQQALEKFNTWVKNNEDFIDDAAMPVCMECGDPKLSLCEHFIHKAKNTVEVVEDQLLIPRGQTNFTWRLQWVNKVRRFFTWPKFNFEEPDNGDLGGFSNDDIPQDQLLVPLYNYIRMTKNTHYNVNGVWDRQACLAHCHKIGTRYLDEIKYPVEQRVVSNFVNRFHMTVQRAADEIENQTLHQYRNPTKNLLFLLARGKHVRRGMVMALPVALAMLSPRLRSAIYTALLRPIISYLRIHLQASVELLLHGSALTFAQIVRLIRNVLSVPMVRISSGVASLCCSMTRQSSWLTALTTYLSLSINAICERLLSHITSIGHWCIELSRTWLRKLAYTLLISSLMRG